VGRFKLAVDEQTATLLEEFGKIDKGNLAGIHKNDLR
jgi:hypothetical protein